MLKAEFKVPGFARKYNPAGVYKMVFDGTRFYIGSSGALKTRIRCWRTALVNGVNKNARIRELMKTTKQVEFEILELVTDGSYRQWEGKYIEKYWNDPLLLNYSPNPENCYGIRITEADKKLRKKPIPKPIYKPMAVFNLEGVELARFNYSHEVTAYTGSSIDRITDMLKGRSSQSKGYRFKLLDKEGQYIEPIPFISKMPPLKPKRIKKPNTPSKEVVQFDLQGNEIARHKSIKEVGRLFNRDPSNFKRQVKKSSRNYFKGYIWKYADTGELSSNP